MQKGVISINRKYLPLIILLLIIFTLTILSTILSTILVPAAYLETYYAILFIVFMGCIPTYLIYRRRDILKGKLLLGLRMGKGWYVYGTILSIIFAIIALFFIIVAIRLIWKGSDLGVLGWLLVLSAIIFFGSMPILFLSKFTVTERGIVAGGWLYRWHRIKDFEWISRGNKIFALVIFVKYFGLKIPITIREFPFDSDNTRKKIERIFEKNIEK